jgi:hypothetical protein
MILLLFVLPTLPGTKVHTHTHTPQPPTRPPTHKFKYANLDGVPLLLYLYKHTGYGRAGCKRRSRLFVLKGAKDERKAYTYKRLDDEHLSILHYQQLR